MQEEIRHNDVCGVAFGVEEVEHVDPPRVELPADIGELGACRFGNDILPVDQNKLDIAPLQLPRNVQRERSVAPSEVDDPRRLPA